MKFQGSLQLERYLSEAFPRRTSLPHGRTGQKTPYVDQIDGGWDVMKADGTLIKGFGRNGEKAAKAYLKKNFKKLSK